MTDSSNFWLRGARSFGSVQSAALGAASPRDVLTAASSPLMSADYVPGERVLTPEAILARRQDWQRQILVYATKVPEVAGAASLVRGSCSRVRLLVEGGADEGVRQREQAKLDAFDLGRAARLLWLSGEFYLAVPKGNTAPYSLSVGELDSSQRSYRVVGGAGAKVPMLDDWFRVWIPSDLNRFHATSPNQAAMDLIDAMYLHQLADTAVATSRLAGAGILIWPTSRKRMGLVDGKPQRGSQEELLKDFIDIAQKAIADHKSLDATIPVAVFVDAESTNYKPELLRIDREDHADQYEKRFATYMERYGVAVDLPVETIKGLGDSSRFTAWQIREDKASVYLMPFLEEIANAYWRRHLLKVDSSLRIKVDASALTRKPDITEIVMQMLQLRVVTTESALDALALGDLSKLETVVPPVDDYSSNTVNRPPSDFQVNGDRGGGRFRERP